MESELQIPVGLKSMSTWAELFLKCQISIKRCDDLECSVQTVLYHSHWIQTTFNFHRLFFLCFVLFSLFLCFYCGTSLLVRCQILSQINTWFLLALRNTSFFWGPKHSTDAFLQSFYGVRSFCAAILTLHFLLGYFICNFLWEQLCLSEMQVPILGDLKENTHPFSPLSVITNMFYFSVQVVFIPKNPDIFEQFVQGFRTGVHNALRIGCKPDVSNDFRIVRMQHNLCFSSHYHFVK